MKRILLFAAIGALLSAVSLSLAGCSKDKKEEEALPGDFVDRHVLLRILNKSSINTNDLSFHFHDDKSHCDGYAIYTGGPDWSNLNVNQFISLGRAKDRWDDPNRFVNDAYINNPNFKFEGSTAFDWHQSLIIGIGGNDQCKMQIKGPANVNYPKDIHCWFPWLNPGRKVDLIVEDIHVRRMTESTFGGYDVLIYIAVRDKK